MTTFGHFGGDHMVCQFGPLRIWAERGLIHVEDERDNSYECVSVTSNLHRMQAIQDMLVNSRKHGKVLEYMDDAEFTRSQRMLEQMIQITRLAQEQGMPGDSSFTHHHAIKRPRTVVLPGVGSIM